MRRLTDGLPSTKDGWLELLRTHGSAMAVASHLGVSRFTVGDRLKSFGIEWSPSVGITHDMPIEELVRIIRESGGVRSAGRKLQVSHTAITDRLGKANLTLADIIPAKSIKTAILNVSYDFPKLTRCMYVIPIADPQIGEPEFQEETLLAYRDWILEHEEAYTGILGDMFSTYVINNKAVDFFRMKYNPKQCVEMAEDILKPIKKRILWFQLGNHEWRAYQATGRTLMSELVKALGFKEERVLARTGVLINLKVGKIPYSIYSLHGWGGSRKTGGQLNKVEEMAGVVRNCDVYLQGHEHTLFASRWDGQEANNTSLRQLYVGCGTFCGYTDFQAGVARRMPNVGSPRVRLDGTRKDIHVSI